MAETWSGEFYCVKCKAKREARARSASTTRAPGWPRPSAPCAARTSTGSSARPETPHRPQRTAPPPGGAVRVSASCRLRRLWMSADPGRRPVAACRHGGRRRWTDLARPVLRDGLHVVRRDDRHLQVGLDPPDRLVLRRPAGPARRADPPRPPPARRAPRRCVDDWSADGWVVDAADPSRSPRAPSAGRRWRSTVDATVARPVVAGLRRRRARALAEQRPHAAWWSPSASRGAASPTRWSATTSPTSGWPCCPRRCGSAPSSSPAGPPACAASTPTSASVDPRRATVLHQLEELPVGADADPDPCLVQLGGRLGRPRRRTPARRPRRRPSGRRRVTVTDDLEVTRRDWLRHPHCGCAWG